MSILYDESKKLFTLHTKSSTYQMQAADYGYLLHLYYGKRIDDGDMSGLLHRADHGFCPCPNEANLDRTFSLDFMPQEYSVFGAGDFRTPCLSVTYPNGSSLVDLRYACHRIFHGKPKLDGLPALYSDEENCDTLEIILTDRISLVTVKLLYSTFEEQDVIARSCKICNLSANSIYLNTAQSCCLDFYDNRYDFITFYGRHAMERCVERRKLSHGKTLVDSIRGTSSHQENPFVILCEPNADEEKGECYGVSLLYSGNFFASAEVDQFGQTRLIMGINPTAFRFKLEAGEEFQTPEAALCYSASGLGELSRNYHSLYRNNLCRGYYKNRRRPILINNWEATYFNFTDDKLVEIAAQASKLGAEMLVMDDGWFGKRENDCSSLGDWTVNEKKIRGGLPHFCERINALGMKLGIWFEPEMVSEDSDLYRSHPDWCLRIPGKPCLRSRYQFVLDMSRQEVVDYLYQTISTILSSSNLESVKWDMNRSLTEAWSAALPADRQGEVYHRFVLGVYDLLERLTTNFPQVLFEGCSGGGGRFDAGMLYYTPQIWCSDNTDAIDRIEIQYGTSFGYPISAVGSHVSACPNHQTGRNVPLRTRGVVAMAGSFGYELDLGKLSDEEKQEVAKQIEHYKKYYGLIHDSNYYRLTSPKEKNYAAWQFVSLDKTKALVSCVLTNPGANMIPDILKLKGLSSQKRYRLQWITDNHTEFCSACHDDVFRGEALMNAGFRLPRLYGDYPCAQIVLNEE